ncbi:5-methylcytosine-specific restriction endonuclease system specificity protein McrC [Intestinibacter sp.]|uniref:5-methylcytosine-specific restriction endonuclease system specificity protein McrC n=1 Tax=Intestinibacter sp. TaxID=1965304 RepID=UPI003F13671B
MIKDRSIFIKNIYYMLAYVYTDLIQKDYRDIAVEKFENTGDILSVILFKMVSKQMKRGMIKKYIGKHEETEILKGKINISESIKLKASNKNKLYCEFDKLSINNYLNSIIKTTIKALILSKDISEQNKKNLKKLMFLFSDVDLIGVDKIRWSDIDYNRNNKSYISIINICYLVLNDLLLSTDDGQYRLANFFSEKKMYSLYEKFVLKYYQKHYPNLHPRASKIKWNLDDEANQFLPEMKTDITLKGKDKILIIDTKYYEKSMQTMDLYNSRSIHSNNLYQIFTYVKNRDTDKSGNVSGLLLYAKTDESVIPNGEYMMSGNKIMVKTLDLNTEFKFIAQSLNEIAEDLM